MFSIASVLEMYYPVKPLQKSRGVDHGSVCRHRQTSGGKTPIGTGRWRKGFSFRALQSDELCRARHEAMKSFPADSNHP